MENTKNGKTVNKALMMGAALVSLNALAVTKAQAATGTGAMSAIILAPVSISATATLHFGSLTEGGAGGTAIIDVANGRTVGGGVTGITGGPATASGSMQITGSTGVNIDLVVLNTGTITVDDAGTGTAMSVTAFNLRTNSGGITETITLTASPTSIPVGATLNVGAAQLAGTYTGTYQVTAVYQ